MRRLIILDYFFTPEKGHDRDYDYSIADEAINQGIKAEIWAPKRGHQGLPEYVTERLENEVKKEKNIVLQVIDGLVRGGELRRILKTSELDENCMILIQKIDYSFMLSFFSAVIGLKVRPRFVVIIRRGMRDQYLGHKLIGALLISLINYPFMKYLHARKKFLFWSDSEMITEALKLDGLGDARTLPIPHLPDRHMVARNGRQKLVGYLGGMRLEKGAALLPGLVEKILSQRQDLSFLLHVYLHHGDTAELQAIKDKLLVLAARYPQNIEIIDRYLPEKDYKAQLARCAIVLVPYQGFLYGLRTSGVVAEAIACGSWAVVPKGTWMARQATKYEKIITFDGFSVEAVFAALEGCVSLDLKINIELVGKQIDEWYAFHSAKNYVELLKTEG
jgi:glycosyltransferase involved in cell wall biosynthesis